jgi:hypothetical protein
VQAEQARTAIRDPAEPVKKVTRFRAPFGASFDTTTHLILHE